MVTCIVDSIHLMDWKCSLNYFTILLTVRKVLWKCTGRLFDMSFPYSKVHSTL